MAKTFRHLYEQVVSFENLWLAYRKTLRGKRYKEAAVGFDADAEENILQLQRELKEKTYRPGGYRHFYVYEPKRRRISAAPFRDRLAHHALVNVLEPIYEARFSEASCACRKDKGTHAAIERAHWGVRNCEWFLKGDVVKFFPSVDHEVMKRVLFRKIADSGVQWLIGVILDSGRGVLDGERPPMWFAEDDLLAPAARPKGLPIGNLTSQFFANVLLNELDQFVHCEIKPREYVRYADDFLMFDNDRAKLVDALSRVPVFLEGVRLRCHPGKTSVRPSAQGVKFLGFRLLPQTRRLHRDGIGRFRQRMRHWRALGRDAPSQRVTASVRGWLAHARFGNCHAMIREVLQDVRV
jgi:retron-type reverse transcriptase